MDSEEITPPEEEPVNDVRVETDSVSTTDCPECGCEIDVAGIASFDEVECPDCSHRVTVPAKLGHFFLTKMLGAGGMGAVYVAKDEALGRQVAVKVMLKSLGDDPAFIESFKREAQAAAKINHPNICQIYSFGTEKGQPYIIMEYISGERFDEMVEGTAKIDQGLVMQVGHDIAQGLAAAYEEDLLHGDIKPENILLDEKLRAKLVDFGIASVAGQASDGIWGTPYYIAPEKILRHKPDGRSDMYSLGATLYHALTGKPPFEGKTPVEVVKARLNRDPVPISKLRPDLKPEVVQVIHRMLQRSPAMRHPTYASLVSDLGNCVTVCGGRKKSLSQLKKSGRIILTKHQKSKFTSSSGSETASPQGSSVSKKSLPKIKVPKRSFTISSSQSPAKTGSISPQSKPVTPKKPPSKAPLAVFLIIVAFLVFGGGGYYLWDQKQKDIANKRQMFAYNNAVSDMGREMLSVSNTVNSITKIINKASEFPASVSSAVKIVTGEELNYPPPLAVDSSVPQPAPATNDQKTDKEPASGNKDDKAKAADGSEEKPVAEPAPPAKDDPEIVRLAKKVIDNCILIKNKQELVDEKQNLANTAFDEGRNSKNPAIALTKLNEIRELLKSLQEIEKDAKSALEKTASNAADIENMRIAFEKKIENQRMAEQEAERQRLAAEESARKEEERLALIEAEKGLVEAARQQAVELYKANNYADGLNILQMQAKDLTTDEAKNIMDGWLEQGRLLKEMKEYLAKQLTDDFYAWGWIQDGRAVDVVKATTDKITVRTREAEWIEVTIPQMLHFFKKYMNKQTVPLKILARQNLAAAIYCQINGGPKYAATFAETAVMHDPNIAPLLNKVMPPADD